MTRKYIANVSTRKVGSEVSIPFTVEEDELDGLSAEGVNQYLDQVAQDVLSSVWAYEIWWEEDREVKAS